MNCVDIIENLFMYLFIYIKMRAKGKKNIIIPKTKSFSKQLCTNIHENNSVNVVKFIRCETNMLILSGIGNFA